MTDETNAANAAPATDTAASTAGTAEPAAPVTEPAAEAAGQAAPETGADTPDKTTSATDPSAVATKESALNDFISSVSHVELLGSIEEGAGYLLKMIESIPEGIAHGWHSLAAEIRSRI